MPTKPRGVPGGHEPVARQLWVILAMAAMLTVNVLANALPLHGHTTGELAHRFHERFRPADYTFSIWSVIYAGLLAYVFFQGRPSQRRNARLACVAPAFIASCLANVAWVFCWHFERIGLSLVAMLALLATLVSVHRRLHRSGWPPPRAAELWCVDAPFRVYLAWISVATFANFSAWLEARSLHPANLSADALAISLLVGVALVSAFVGWVLRDALYLAVVLWALIGIGVRNGPDSPVTATAIGGIVLTSMLLVRALLWSRSHGGEPPFQRAGAAT